MFGAGHETKSARNGPTKHVAYRHVIQPWVSAFAWWKRARPIEPGPEKPGYLASPGKRPTILTRRSVTTCALHTNQNRPHCQGPLETVSGGPRRDHPVDLGRAR
jgi:hypothetical protein